MKRAIVLSAGLLLAAGCAVEHTQTDLRSIKRADRDALREAGKVAVVTYAPPAPTYNGYVDQRSIDVLTQTGVEAPLDRIRERVVVRLVELGYPAALKQPPVMAPSDGFADIRASVTAPLVLDFDSRSWGLGNLRGGGEPKPDDPIYTHHHVRARLLRLSSDPNVKDQVLWQAVCGLRGYKGDETVKLKDLLATGGVVLRQKLVTAADGCAEELVGFFQGAD
jgi:hypothetical protein